MTKLDPRIEHTINRMLQDGARRLCGLLSADFCCVLVAQGDNVFATTQMHADFVAEHDAAWRKRVATELREYADAIESGAVDPQPDSPITGGN
jgi:hypothetical protein